MNVECQFKRQEYSIKYATKHDVMEKSFTQKKPSTRGTWSLVEKRLCCSTGIILSRQSNYSTVKPLLARRILKKGGVAMYIFRTSITTKDGTKLYAKDYGKKAFKIWIGRGSEPNKNNK